MSVKLNDAIRQVRDEIRDAVVESRDQDVVFTAEQVELELGITFSEEVQAGGGIKLFALLDLSASNKVSEQNVHRIKLTLGVADREGKPLKVHSQRMPGGL